jgi:hypothetical protein
MGVEDIEKLAEQDIQQLADDLANGRLFPLRDRFDRPRRVRQQLQRYSSRLYLFPFGVAPMEKAPVQVFRNGLAVWMGEEAKVVCVGNSPRAWAVVVDPPCREGTMVQAEYVVVPDVG